MLPKSWLESEVSLRGSEAGRKRALRSKRYEDELWSTPMTRPLGDKEHSIGEQGAARVGKGKLCPTKCQARLMRVFEDGQKNSYLKMKLFFFLYMEILRLLDQALM